MWNNFGPDSGGRGCCAAAGAAESAVRVGAVGSLRHLEWGWNGKLAFQPLYSSYIFQRNMLIIQVHSNVIVVIDIIDDKMVS